MTPMYELDRFDEWRRTALEAEAQDAFLAIKTSGARLRVVAEPVSQLGLVNDDQIEITVYRTEDGQEAALSTGPDMPLQSGDMLEVEIKMRLLELWFDIDPAAFKRPPAPERNSGEADNAALVT